MQDNHSLSKKNVFRGLHYQWDKPMGKLVRVVKGSGIDFIVDIRKDSPLFGFLSLQDDTHLIYKTSAYYNSFADGCINPLSSELNLEFPIDILDIILSEKDKNAQSFTEYKQNPKF